MEHKSMLAEFSSTPAPHEPTSKKGTTGSRDGQRDSGEMIYNVITALKETTPNGAPLEGVLTRAEAGG